MTIHSSAPIINTSLKLNLPTQMFITSEKIESIADELLIHFEFNLTSASRLPEIAEVVADHMADNKLPTRLSLCLTIAKVMKAKWSNRTLRTKQIIEQNN